MSAAPASYQWRDDPKLQGLDIDAPFKSVEGKRDPELANEIIAQFDVANSPRYARNSRGGSTWCNRFVCDVTHAFGCKIKYQLANDFPDWMAKTGVIEGWRRTPLSDVKMALTSGHIVVAVQYNPEGHGHVGIVRVPIEPLHLKPYSENLGLRSLFVAVAGSINSPEMPLLSSFNPKREIVFWRHP